MNPLLLADANKKYKTSWKKNEHKEKISLFQLGLPQNEETNVSPSDI